LGRFYGMGDNLSATLVCIGLGGFGAWHATLLGNLRKVNAKATTRAKDRSFRQNAGALGAALAPGAEAMV
jgi:hypothetical protein